MTTLATMKARIARELDRDDIDDDIADAISTAISALEDERFRFQVSRSNTLTTVASQEFYDETDMAAWSRLIKVDFVTLLVGDTVYSLVRREPHILEAWTLNGATTGQPGHYGLYADKLRLYPVPSAAWTLRVAGLYYAAAPANDDEASNPWMTAAERAVRCRAKVELAAHVLRDAELANDMSGLYEEAVAQLRSRMTMFHAGEAGLQPEAWGAT